MRNYLKINRKILEKIDNFCVLLDNNYQVKQFRNEKKNFIRWGQY